LKIPLDNTCSSVHETNSTVFKIGVHETSSIEFGTGAKVYFYLGLIGSGLTAFFYLFWSPDPYAVYGSFSWIMNEAYRGLSSGDRIFLGISGIITCASWAYLLKFKTRVPVYIIVGWSLLSCIMQISNGQNVVLMVLSNIISLGILYAVLKKYWENMKA